MKFHATAAAGISPLLAEELHALGAESIRTAAHGVEFQGTLATAYRACLWSRLASRVLLPLTDVAADDADRLYAGAREIRWERHLRSSGTLAVDCSASDAAITHSRYAALKVKDAVVDRLRERFGERPSVDTETPDLRINLHLRGSRARISIDLSGAPLHRRGYRRQGGAAPLKENLAAAILVLGGWPGVFKDHGALLDPMCGSATLLIEGALMAGDIAPGLYRGHFGFLGWKKHEPAVWEMLLSEARERRSSGGGHLPPVVGFDRDPAALDAARQNIAAAGLEEAIVVARRTLSPDMELPALPPGLLITNPPYGERIGAGEELRTTYLALGELLRRRLPDWRAAVFTGNPELSTAVGLAADHTIPLRNGPLSCQLLTYPAAKQAETANVIADPGARSFVNRLRKNLRHLGRWARREGVDCYRLYDRDIPEYAVAIDLYRGEANWVHVQEYAPPRSVDAQQAGRRLEQVLAGVREVLEVPPERLFVKVRQRQKGRAQYRKLGSGGRFFEVPEWNCRFLVNFTDYLDTGLFLDHRLTRRRLQAEARGKQFLNLFCYTGTATVHAALGGARRTTSVDLSRTYLDWAGRNLRLNGIEPGEDHELIQADCRAWLSAAAAGKRRFDLIFMDPPTFSASKRMDGTLDIQRDHIALIRDAAALLNVGGELVFSTNFRGFVLDEKALGDLTVEEITGVTLPEDFRRRPPIHRSWRVNRQRRGER